MHVSGPVLLSLEPVDAPRALPLLRKDVLDRIPPAWNLGLVGLRAMLILDGLQIHAQSTAGVATVGSLGLKGLTYLCVARPVGGGELL